METIIYRIDFVAQKWYSFMVASSIQLGLFIILIAMLSFLFRKQSARFLYWLWLIGLLKILIPPTIKLPAFLSHSSLIPNPSISGFSMPVIQFTTVSSPELSYQGFLFLCWAGIVLFLLGFWLFKLLRFNRAITRSRYEITEKILSIHVFDPGKRVRFFSAPDIAMPFTRGVFYPKIYLPESALSWSVGELKALIFHELAHVKRKDLLVIAFQNLVQLFYFFHPLVWLASIQLCRYREKACDDSTIVALQGNYMEYGKLLLKSVDQVVNWKPLPSLTTYFHQSGRFLVHRFEYILNRKEFIMYKLTFLQKMLLVGLMVVGVALSCQKKEQPSQPQQITLGDNIVIDISKETLQAGLPDSQKVDYDTPPMPVGGFEALKDYLLFPEFGKKQGTVINAYINQQGDVYSIRYINKFPRRMKVKPIELFALSEYKKKLTQTISKIKWQPATKDGKSISAWITLPIQYVLKIAPEDIISPSEVPPPAPSSGNGTAFFVAYDEPPKPIGGFKAIQDKLVYPELARKAGIEGTVTVQAQINESGKVVDTRILKSLGENNGCDEAAVAAIKATQWEPAKAKGSPVTVWVSVPVRFKLSSGATSETSRRKSGYRKQLSETRLKKPVPPPIRQNDEKIFVAFDEPPKPIGGFEAIQDKLVYPAIARKAGIEGTVVVQARISESGEVIETKILRSLGEDNGCDEAAVAAIKATQWEPAKYKGMPTAVWVSIPVRFKLH